MRLLVPLFLHGILIGLINGRICLIISRDDFSCRKLVERTNSSRQVVLIKVGYQYVIQRLHILTLQIAYHKGGCFPVSSVYEHIVPFRFQKRCISLPNIQIMYVQPAAAFCFAYRLTTDLRLAPIRRLPHGAASYQK